MHLSDDQRRVLDCSVEIVSACPGAGKTRAIVARFLQQVDSLTRGVALISFTNAAVEEIIARLESREVFLSPHFVGTFDRFIHQFIVTPHVLRTARIMPKYLDTWMDLGGAEWLYLRDRSVPGAGIALSDFVRGADGSLSLSPSPSSATRVYIRTLQKAGVSLDPMLRRADAVIGGLLEKHIYDCDHARILALNILREVVDDPGPRRLVARFSEIIIDEFQDCSDIEYQIRACLAKLGVKVLVVADPDQGIYEFRNAKPRMFSTLVEGSASEVIVKLDHNYRSSEAICSLVSSVRALSPNIIVPSRDFCGSPVAPNVYVIIGTDSFKLNTFRKLSQKYEIDTDKRIVLAPTRKQAALLAGDLSANFETGYGHTGKLLAVLAKLRYEQFARARYKALSGFVDLILEMFDWKSIGLDQSTVEEKSEYLGLQHQAIRLCASKLVRESAKWYSISDVKPVVHEAVGFLVSNLAMQPIHSVAMKFQKPRENDWIQWKTAIELASVNGIRHSHIHGVKGAEFSAVLLHIPHKKIDGVDSGFTAWSSGVDSENRRVLYVGVSRAERLLAISIAKSKKKEIASILDRDGVPYKLIIEEA